jgi:hypothetical protein
MDAFKGVCNIKLLFVKGQNQVGVNNTPHANGKRKLERCKKYKYSANSHCRAV